MNMKKMMIIVSATLCAFHVTAGVREELAEEKAEAQQSMKCNACWDKFGVQKICGLRIGSTVEEINASGVLTQAITGNGYADLKKPFRKFSSVRLYFTAKNRLYFIELSGNSGDYDTGKAEFEAVYNMLTKKFGKELGENSGIGQPDSMGLWQAYWAVNPDSSPDLALSCKQGDAPTTQLVLSNSYMALRVDNGPLARHDSAAAEIEEIDKKLKSFASADEGFGDL